MSLCLIFDAYTEEREVRSNHKLLLRSHVDRHVNARCELAESLVILSPRMAPEARCEQAHGLQQ